VPSHAVGQRQPARDLIAVAAPVAPAREIAGGLELDDDPVDRPFGDADGITDLAQAHLRVLIDAQQHLRVIRQEAPGRRRVAIHH
jgi:hypothetical protein